MTCGTQLLPIIRQPSGMITYGVAGLSQRVRRMLLAQAVWQARRWMQEPNGFRLAMGNIQPVQVEPRALGPTLPSVPVAKPPKVHGFRTS